MAECKACGGKGDDGPHPYCAMRCPVCNGTGVEPVAREPMEASIKDGDFPPFSNEYGCGDNSCWLRTVRGGAGTNGGCRCLEFIPQEFYDKKRILSRALQLAARDRSRLAAAEETIRAMAIKDCEQCQFLGRGDPLVDETAARLAAVVEAGEGMSEVLTLLLKVAKIVGPESERCAEAALAAWKKVRG